MYLQQQQRKNCPPIQQYLLCMASYAFYFKINSVFWMYVQKTTKEQNKTIQQNLLCMAACLFFFLLQDQQLNLPDLSTLWLGTCIQLCHTHTHTWQTMALGFRRAERSRHSFRMSVDILGTSWDQCVSMVQYCFTSTETIKLVRTDSPGRPPRLSTQLLNSERQAHLIRSFVWPKVSPPFLVLSRAQICLNSVHYVFLKSFNVLTRLVKPVYCEKAKALT